MRNIYLVCGKGGVGKTTCASSIAIALSQKGTKTLLISTDFTPALGDIFNKKIGAEFTEINENLYAIEIDHNFITNRWIKKFGPDFYDILSNIINVNELDRTSKHSILEYIGSAPSLHEETILDYIVEISKKSLYKKIIWDSAPAGETLNLLNMPQLLKKHLKSGAKIYDSIDKLKKKFSGKKSITTIINEWIALSDNIYNYLKLNAGFIIVANPERIVYNRTKEIIKTLIEYKMFIHGLIINKINLDFRNHELIEEQNKYIEDYYKLIGNKPISKIVCDILNTRTIEQLKIIGDSLVNELKIE
jgi:arsenite-transporting ATPase